MAGRIFRALASADHHFDEHKRFDLCVGIHDWMADIAKREKVDLFLSAGDIYEGASTPLERCAVANCFTRITEVCPAIISKGNHDRPLDCQILGRLETDHPLIVEERAGVHAVGGAVVSAVAWPDRAALAASVREHGGDRLDGMHLDNAARDAFRGLLLGLAEEMELRAGNELPRIGLGHFMVNGSAVSTGQPLLGMPLNLGLQDLALLRAPLVVCGHIHLPQEWEWNGVRVVYPGSPFATDFGQTEEKSVLLVTYEGPRLVEIVRIPTPAPRMFHVVDEWGELNGHDDWLIGDGNPDEWRGAEIRFRYDVPSDKRDAAKAAAKRVTEEMVSRYGALSAKAEEVVIATTRARVPEIATAGTLGDKLSAMWDARRENLGVRRERLLEKTSQLEVEASHVAA